MKRYRWNFAAGLAVVLVIGAVIGYQWAPTAVSAAQYREQTPEAKATPLPKADAKAPKKEQAWLGVAISAVEGGARVESVVAESPAAKAGVQISDTITAINGNAVANANQLIERVTGMNVGDKASLTLQRNGASQTIDVTLGARPKRLQLGPKGQMPKGHPFGGASGLGGLEGLLSELRDVPADQRFEHYRGGSFSFTDQNGSAITINIVPGVVTAVTSDTVTLRPNGASADANYRVTNTTRGVPGKRGDLTNAVKAQDKVMVVAREGSDEALALFDLKAGRGMFSMFGVPGMPGLGGLLKPNWGGGGFRSATPQPLPQQ